MNRSKVLGAVLVSGLMAAVCAAQTDTNTAQTAPATGTATTAPQAPPTTQTAPSATATPCTNQPMNHKIEVTADSVTCKEAHVSKKQQNTIRWTSPKGTTLSIVFDKEVPFHSLSCRGNACKAKGVKSLPDDSAWSYEAAIDGVKTKDPNVIINP